MMISPEKYIKELENAEYLELIKERDRLISRVKSFEKNEMAGNRSFEWDMNPSPDVKYQCNLYYLAHLCNFMREKYRCEYVWGGRKLTEDMEK